MKAEDAVTTLPGVGPKVASKLIKLNIHTVNDLLFHFPIRYIDYSLNTTINTLQEGELVTIKGKVLSIKNNYLRGRHLTLQKAQISDNTGIIEIVWFNQPFLIKNLTDQTVNLSGKVTRFGRKLTLESPDYEIVSFGKSIHTGRLVPVYPETKGISSKYLRNKINYILRGLTDYTDPLPEEITGKNRFFDLREALFAIHQPKNLLEVEKARKRLAFDELFYIQLISNLRKLKWQKEKIAKKLKFNKYAENIENFIQKLPFKLTAAQERTYREILADLSKTTPMNRLLQGDVGSGKTVVSAIAVYLIHLNGANTLFMAPTEILALQHYQTLKKLLSPYKISIALRTGSESIGKDNSNLTVGTHALLFQKRQFKNVSLVIIDEQHRFGVEQRAKLQNLKARSHLLTMTATPIPRTIALTLYGELDISIIDQMPIGRKIVKTYVVPREKYSSGFNWIRNRIKKSQQTGISEQAFIIYPLIEESEILTEVKAATQEFLRLKKEAFPDLNLGLLHGKLKAKEKNSVIEDFRKGKIDILISTSVVEVGMDIPNASIMVIEDADRFGLAQLHQLRGRVGRNDREAFCFLYSSKITPRLKAMEKNHLGIKLAEIDLKLRGPGEIYGIRQHGEIDLKIADFSDIVLVEETRKAVLGIIEKDPKLKNYPLLLKQIKPKLLKQVNPD